MKTRGWYLVRIEFAAAFVAIGMPAALIALAPPSIGRFGDQPGIFDAWTTWLGIGGFIAGLAWMIRIHRANPESHPTWWRYQRS